MKFTAILLVGLVLGVSDAYAAKCDTKDEKVWHVLIQTHKGTVSVVRNVSKSEAKEILKRLNPWRGHLCVMGCSRLVQDTDAEVLEAFGPEGCELRGLDASDLAQQELK